MFEGSVDAIYIAAATKVPMRAVDEATVVVGAGIDGDRYASKAGQYSGDAKPGRQVTLVEREAVEAAAREYEMAIDAAGMRRNIVTTGVPLNHLVGRRFHVGDVVLEGTRLCEPCHVMNEVFGEGARKALVHRGGLRADVVTGGVIRPGDPVTAAD